VLDTELSRQGMRTLTVDSGEIDGLGPTSHHSGHRGQVNIENQGCGLAMNITAGTEGFDERRITGQVSK
jgi:hypothetical protein